MTGLRLSLAFVLLAARVPGAASAQSTQHTVVVQVVGTNLYFDKGTDAGVRAGDTITVRRTPSAAPVGTVVVIAATGARSVVTFAGTPFPATRGDTLYITPGPIAAIAVPAARASTPETRPPPPRAPPAAAPSGTTIDGALGLEMWGAHTLTVGLGSNPVRTTRDVAMPAVRLRTRIARTGSVFNLNLRAQHRTGPQSLFDRATRVRVYEARYDRTAGALRLSLGRFFSDFDHASGFWDGASVRVGDDHRLFGGVAAGFEPLRGNEEFSGDVPKYAAFVGARAGTGQTGIASDLAFHQTLPRDATLKRTVLDWSLRLHAGRFGLAQEVETSSADGGGPWSISRFILRASTPVGTGVELYGSAVSDRPPTLDTAWVLPLTRRERVAAGISYQAGNGFFADVNGAINGPRDSTSGYSAGAMFAFPDLVGTATFAASGSYYTSGGNRGSTVSPSIEFRIGRSRMRAGYQFLLIDGTSYRVTTHGGDFRWSQSVSSRVDWVVQVNGRTGHNLRSTSAYSSFEVRF